MTMDEALEQLQRGDTKDRLAGVERLRILLEQSQKSLSEKEVMTLVDASTALLKDNNFKVCQGTLHLLTLAAVMSGEYLRVHYNQLVPAVVERLGDNKQTVRDASRRLLLALMEVSTPLLIADRAGSYAWTHKNWRVREEFAHTIASACNLFSSTGFHFQRIHLPANLQLLEDSNSNVREAALVCLEEMYRHGGQNVKDELQRHHLRPAQMKEIAYRFDRIEPIKQPDNEVATTSGAGRSNQRNSCRSPLSPILRCNVDTKVCQIGGNRRPRRRCSPESKSTHFADTHPGGLESGAPGGSGGYDKSVGPIKVFAERELTKELDKIVSLLKAEQDWSVRMAAMQKLEGIIVGGAVEFGCFLTLFKNFLGPLSIQLLDRRSSIVKQACHLLNLLSNQLQIDFESFAEVFIPILFRSVVVTVLVIGESADHCIKTMLENCRVARILPRIIECAKHDRNAVLRTKCCNYALLVLEKWGDSPEVHRFSDLYQDLIRCCTLDAIAEVRSSARACYREYSKLWPDRARRVFSSLDPAVQKLFHDEEGVHRRYLFSPAKDSEGDEHIQLRQFTRMSVHSGQALKGEISHNRDKSKVSSSEHASASNLLQRKSLDLSSENNTQKVLESNLLNANDTTLKGVDSSEGVFYAPERIAGGSYREIHAPASTGTVRVIVDSPSARDPPYPASTPASYHCHVKELKVTGPSATVHTSAGLEDSEVEMHERHLEIKTKALDVKVGGASVGSVGANRVCSFTETPSYNIFEGRVVDREIKQNPTSDAHVEKLPIADSISSIGSLSHRISLRHTASGKSSECTSAGNIHQGGLYPLGEMLNYMDGVMSLNDALTEGLGPNADWSARVGAFTYIQKSLQQGSKGSQEVAQNFDRVMKLFTTHLDDPHWRVAQAALSALIELVPTSRRMFEPYLERTLPSVFARLVDSKDSIRQLSFSALETIGDTFTIETLLLPLLRSIDEQRIPKARMTVIEFAIAAFAKLANVGTGTGSTALLKLWLAKLAPLATDKNAKLREAAIAGIISVYSQFDPTIVLNFILGLSIEEQSMLRRSLKQFTPRIDLDLMAFLHNKGQRPRAKPAPDQTDATGGTAEVSTGRGLSSLRNDGAETRGSST